MLVSFTLGLLGGIFYGTFLEWFIHRVAMHTTKISQLSFDRHAIEHHMSRRSLKSFYIPPEDNEKYALGESSIIPLLWFGHLPLYILVATIGGVSAGVGMAAAGLLYLLGYEFIHFFIHVPKNHWFQRTKLFRFYCEYHRVHHHKARVNYNVVCPLADFILRTQSWETINVEPSRPEFMLPDVGPKSVWGKRATTASDSEAR